MRAIELWADSFHEGDWACNELSARTAAAGGSHESQMIHGFVPQHRFEFDDGGSFQLTVFGSYGSWKPVPDKVSELLGWGKPDLIAYDAEQDRILFAVEETAAVPTGNQALQRCERLYGSARQRIPFWYLLSEYGRHVDGGVRRASIWPAIMALKLTQDKRVPSVVLHYSDAENPETYAFGEGVEALFSTLLALLRAHATDADPLAAIREKLEAQYRSMLEFLGTQWERMLHFLPGEEALKKADLAGNYAAVAADDESAEEIIWSTHFLRWPPVGGLPSEASDLQVARPLMKGDSFCLRLEADVGAGRAYGLTQNVGSRPQRRESLEYWLQQQKAAFDAGPVLDPRAEFDPSIGDFPTSESGNCHVTTATRIVFLYDAWADLRDAVVSAFPRLDGKLDGVPDERPAMVYISNSVKPGRIFGDPFAGQLAAFAVAFGALDPEPRVVLAYYPHQSFTQALPGQRGEATKGLQIMRELTTYLLFGGGVALAMPGQEVL